MSVEHDRLEESLSEYLDGGLPPGERAGLERHLEECAPCRATLRALAGVVAAARALPEREPARDLWPGIEAALDSRGSAFPWRLALAFAAGVLVTLAAWFAFARGAPPGAGPALARAERYLLLLHEPAGFGQGLTKADHAELVERYSRWAQDLGARCVAGEELAPGGTELRPGAEPAPAPEGARVGGFFLLETADEAEAVALARTCPHLAQGGWIELRRVNLR
jgi:hypothetical protein